MVDKVSKTERSRVMSRVRSRGNASTEEVFRALLQSVRLVGWRRHLALPGRPDFAFPRARVAVFLDGCFWHGCPRCYRAPADNREYWSQKLRRNRARDRRVRQELRARGWVVLRVWEHALSSIQKQRDVIARVRRTVERRGP